MIFLNILLVIGFSWNLVTMSIALCIILYLVYLLIVLEDWMKYKLYCLSIFHWFSGLYWLFLRVFPFYFMKISTFFMNFREYEKYCPRILIVKRDDFRWFPIEFKLKLHVKRYISFIFSVFVNGCRERDEVRARTIPEKM